MGRSDRTTILKRNERYLLMLSFTRCYFDTGDPGLDSHFLRKPWLGSVEIDNTILLPHFDMLYTCMVLDSFLHPARGRGSGTSRYRFMCTISAQSPGAEIEIRRSRVGGSPSSICVTDKPIFNQTANMKSSASLSARVDLSPELQA